MKVEERSPLVHLKLPLKHLQGRFADNSALTGTFKAGFLVIRGGERLRKEIKCYVRLSRTLRSQSHQQITSSPRNLTFRIKTDWGTTQNSFFSVISLFPLFSTKGELRRFLDFRRVITKNSRTTHNQLFLPVALNSHVLERTKRRIPTPSYLQQLSSQVLHRHPTPTAYHSPLDFASGKYTTKSN